MESELKHSNFAFFSKIRELFLQYIYNDRELANKENFRLTGKVKNK